MELLVKLFAVWNFPLSFEFVYSWLAVDRKQAMSCYEIKVAFLFFSSLFVCVKIKVGLAKWCHARSHIINVAKNSAEAIYLLTENRNVCFAITKCH